MLYYNRIDVSEGIDVNKTSGSKECITCQHWHYLDQEFRIIKKIIFISFIKMNKEFRTFVDTEIKKRNFHYSKCSANISNVDIDKMIISNKVSLDKKGL